MKVIRSPLEPNWEPILQVGLGILDHIGISTPKRDPGSPENGFMEPVCVSVIGHPKSSENMTVDAKGIYMNTHQKNTIHLGKDSESILVQMCQGLNSHYFHLIGDGHQPKSVGVIYTHEIRIPSLKVGFSHPQRDDLDHGTNNKGDG